MLTAGSIFEPDTIRTVDEDRSDVISLPRCWLLQRRQNGVPSCFREEAPVLLIQISGPGQRHRVLSAHW